MPKPGVVTARIMEPLPFDPKQDHNAVRLELQRRSSPVQILAHSSDPNPEPVARPATILAHTSIDKCLHTEAEL